MCGSGPRQGYQKGRDEANRSRGAWGSPPALSSSSSSFPTAISSATAGWGPANERVAYRTASEAERWATEQDTTCYTRSLYLDNFRRAGFAHMTEPGHILGSGLEGITTNHAECVITVTLETPLLAPSSRFAPNAPASVDGTLGYPIEWLLHPVSLL